MVLKYMGEKRARVVFDLAILIIAISGVFNLFAWSKLTHVAEQNSRSAQIIRAATGCENVDSVAQCKQRLAAAQQATFVAFQSEQDCLTRRALAQLPPPRYDVPCQLP